MKIELHDLVRMTLVEFADRHDLVMEIHERDGTSDLPRYFAHFKHVDIMDRGCLVGTFGDGNTPEDAMDDYATRISGKLIAINAFQTSERREIYVPIINKRSDT